MTKPNHDGGSFDSRGQAEIEGRAGGSKPARNPPTEDQPPAGPHATPELTNAEATAGSGALPAPTPDGEADAATG